VTARVAEVLLGGGQCQCMETNENFRDSNVMIIFNTRVYSSQAGVLQQVGDTLQLLCQ